ncbi:TetR/AcrR family transcriptional regulator [Stenotrophomonas sp. 278]|uniref:TetR/AcrR family transcriptional regulator n=1 Tax=Stenotrophomonas sp. 278 TaxID=2479851 RepID=UPI0021AD8420|nr:TetR/AcrR family transcriptional regulator [Stenotrophomonas sp. 278]
MNTPTPAAGALDARDHRVFDAVRELMSTQGMQLSMEAVAQQAGCSKQTLYSRYGSKQELLRRVMQRHLCRATAGLRAMDGEDLRGCLLQFAIDHIEHFNEPQVVQARRLIAAEAAQFPQEARALYRDGAGALALHLAEWIATRIERGLLRHDDPHFMAELLLSMIAGLDFEKQRFHTPHRDDAATRRRWAEFAVDSFLQAFAMHAAVPEPHSNQLRSFS